MSHSLLFKNSAHMFLKEKNKLGPELAEGNDVNEGIHNQVIEEVEESRQTENAEPNLEEKKRTRTRAKNEILNTANIEDAPVTFASLPSEGEGEGEEDHYEINREEIMKNK